MGATRPSKAAVADKSFIVARWQNAALLDGDESQKLEYVEAALSSSKQTNRRASDGSDESREDEDGHWRRSEAEEKR